MNYFYNQNKYLLSLIIIKKITKHYNNINLYSYKSTNM